jgi:DNA modification methylase
VDVPVSGTELIAAGEVFDAPEAILYRGDCLDLMQQHLPDNSVDLVLADLPYGTTQNKWDSVIPLDKLWAAYGRILCPLGSVVLTATQPFTSVLVTSNLKWFRYDWTWRKLGKATGHLNAARQPLRDKEDILVFSPAAPRYNPQMTVGTPFKDKAGKNHADRSSMTDSYGSFTNMRNDNSGFRYPRSVLEFQRVERRTIHPTQKPVDLFEYLVRTYSDTGNVVLDNTMGSGTTGVACANTGRFFIGMEQDPTYFKAACARIIAAQDAAAKRVP